MTIYREIPDPQSFYADIEQNIEEMVNKVLADLRTRIPVVWAETHDQAAAYEAHKRFEAKGYVVTEVKARQRQDGQRQMIWYFSVTLPPYTPPQ